YLRTIGNMEIGTPIQGSKPRAAAASSRELRRRHLVVYLPALVGGGAERVAALLASALCALGHHVTLVADFDAPQNAHFVDQDVERVTRGNSSTRGIAHGKDVLRLARFLKRRKPDVALSIGASANIKLVLAHALAGLGDPIRARIVLSYHGPSNFGTGWLGWS